MKMSAEYRKWRRDSGLARLENDCRLTAYNGRQVKAYKVPGTAEAGTRAMLMAEWNRQAKTHGWSMFI